MESLSQMNRLVDRNATDDHGAACACHWREDGRVRETVVNRSAEAVCTNQDQPRLTNRISLGRGDNTTGLASVLGFRTGIQGPLLISG